jgi:hypothetical protein
MMPSRLNRPPLAPIDAAALPAPPREAGEGEHFVLQRVVDRNGEGAVAIHFCHLAEKIRSMAGASLENVILPLMDHLMGQRADELGKAMWRLSQ